MNKFLVITSIAKPNVCLKHISNKSKKNSVNLVIIGDKKSPKKFKLKNCIFLSINDQKKKNYFYTKFCPENSYARKNIGYIYAIKKGADVIFETDDDNKILNSFFKLKPKKNKTTQIINNGWTNIYSFFSNKLIWPRGFPLSEIKNNKKKIKLIKKFVSCPINQRLVDLNPDVDAVYRLVKKLPINFNKSKDIALGKNSWCTFNSQNTVWHREAYPLLYLPAFSSFRMSDIWRSLIAQRICWENNWNILHSNSTVVHERNDHNLIKDFADEVSGYLNNKEISSNLENLKLKSGNDNLAYNLIKCYELLCKMKLLDVKELILLKCWIKDIKNI